MSSFSRRAAAMAALLLLTRVAGAQTVNDVPIPGGTAAMARALGIDPVPDRPRFVAEIVRVVHDIREGKNAEADARLARMMSQVDTIGRFQAALAGVQPGDAGITLKMAALKNDRDRLTAFLALVGLTLRENNKTFKVERTDDALAAQRVTLLADLGVDLTQLAAGLTAGDSVRLRIPTETVPMPLSTKLWSEALLRRPVSDATLFLSILSDRRAALMARGLAALDDETLSFLESHPPILTDMYERQAEAFAAFGDALRVRDGRVVPPGGADGVRAWEAVLDQKVTRPDRFIRALYGAEKGRVALVYATLAHLDAPHLRFALGSWMPDASKRVEQFKALVKAETAHREWNAGLAPFARPSHDPSVMLARVRVTPNGDPVRPAARLFWRRAFESADLPDDPARLLRDMREGGTIDAGWLAENIRDSDVRARAGRLEQLTFGERVFAAATDADLPNALVAVRAVPRFRMLMLTLDRMGVRNPAVYAAAARHAERLSRLDGRRRFVAIGQFQSAVAVIGRLQRVHTLDTAAAEALVAGLAALPLNEAGEYAGGVARWIQRQIAPALGSPGPPIDIDEQLVRSSAGVPAAAARRIDWEGRTYRIDLVAPEQRRLARAREKMGAPPVRLAIAIEQVATKLSAPSVSAGEVRESIDALKALAPALTAMDARSPVDLPPGVDAPNATASTIADKAAQDLSAISPANGQGGTARVAQALFGLSDEVLAQALLPFVYALDIGNPDGPTLMGGDVSRRHDFGFGTRDEERQIRATWAAPVAVIDSGAPWHVAGSLLSLDTGLSSLALRRIDADDLPDEPTLAMPDRETFSKTVVLINPFDLTDEGRDAIVAAIARGRARVAAMSKDAWDEAADQIGMDGWRRRAGRWALASDAALVPSFFSLVELLWLGGPPADLPLDRWGMAGDASDACLCTQAPVPGRQSIVEGRPHLGLLAAEVADINLRVAEALATRRLPAQLAPGVLAGAVQDYVDRVRPLHAGDWLTLVRTAQAIPDDRIDDYVAALTAGGPLVADRTIPR